MMKYSYEFTFDDNGSISIRRWNLFKTEQLEIWKFLSLCDDWSDIFYCRVFLSKRRVIIYNEKFFPSEEDNWFRYEKQNNLFALYYIGKRLGDYVNRLADDFLKISYNQWKEGSYIYKLDNNPILFDRMEIRQSRINERTYLVLSTDHLFAHPIKYSHFKNYKAQKFSGESLLGFDLNNKYNFIFYPLVFTNFCEDSWICANPPLGFSDNEYREGKFYNRAAFSNPSDNIPEYSYKVKNAYEYVHIINSLDIMHDEVNSLSGLHDNSLERGIKVHIHNTEHFPAIDDDNIKEFNVLLS